MQVFSIFEKKEDRPMLLQKKFIAVLISVDYSRDVPTKVLVMTMWLIIFKITLNQGFLFI